MNIELLIDQDTAIVYDRDAVTDPDPGLFQPAFWVSSGGMVGSAPGRGAAFFLDTPFGDAVLRPYRRGGWAARFSEDRYLFSGYENSRPLREFRLLAELARLGLPAPRPLAAICRRSGFTYRAALLMRTIPNTTTLADSLGQGLPRATWVAIGRCIRQFHHAGVLHADLNVRNILLQRAPDQVFLIDFDRGRMTPGRRAGGRRNLARLRRSLEKCWPQAISGELGNCWKHLEAGYRD